MPIRFLLLALAGSLASIASGQDQPKRLVMISVDGLRATTLRDAESLQLRIPNLKEFRDHGAASEGLEGVFPTVTYPSHTTMVTGQPPAGHGIVGNTLFDPERRLSGAWFWYSEMIKAPTLWDAAKSAGLTTAAVSWPVTVGARIDYNVPEFRELRSIVDALDLRAVTTAGLIGDFERARGPIRFAGEHHDGLIAEFASFIVSAHKPHLLLIHLADLDHEQHLHGPESPEALRTLEAIDECIGSIRKAVEAAGLAGGTRWIVVSDHGFLPVEREFNPDALLSSLGVATDAAEPKAWRVATMRNGGSAAFIAKDPGDKDAQALVEQTLRRLQAEGRWGIDRILDKNDLVSLRGYPDAFLAVSMAPGWSLGSGQTGPWVTPSRSRGTHGYLPGPRELDCTFVAFGPGIEARRLPRGGLIDVARTAAARLGISMPTAGGRDLLGSAAAVVSGGPR
jgi:predicted AlkP superfamily pyrophosphatase or phosphodiesterase